MRRPLGDLLVLIVVGTVCVSVVLAAGGLAVAEIVNADRDSSSGFAALAAVLSNMSALIAGYLAGRTERRRRDDTDE